MANSGQEAKFSLGLEDNISKPAASAADSLESLRQRISGGEDAIKNMRSAFNRLRGSTDEIKAAKAELTAKLNAERDAVSAANLKLLKSGTTYDVVAAKTKKLAAEQETLNKSADASRAKSLGAALTATGGPAGSLRDKMNSLREAVGGISKPMDLAKFAAVGLVAAALAVAAAVVAGAYAIGKWIVVTADAARSANLLREAWSGSARNAGNLGTQIDALAEKVPTSTAVLNDLAISLMKSKLGGQTTVDAFNAVGQASAALGDEAAGKIKDFIERGRLMGRMQIDPREMLEGFGNLKFDDVARALAKNTGKTVEAARQELRMGKTKLGDGTKAMRDAVEANFGDLNLRKMMSLSGLAEQLQKKFALLTKGVNIDPLLAALNRLAMVFDTSTVEGAALKETITAFGNIMVKTLAASMPFVEVFLKGMIIAALDLGIGLLQLRNSMRKAFGNSDMLKNVDLMNIAFESGKIVIGLVAGAFLLLGATVALAVGPFVALYVAWVKLGEYSGKLGKMIREFFLGTDWSAMGTAIVDGLIDGLKNGVSRVTDTVKGLAASVKNAFTGKDGIDSHSPSKVFHRYGRFTTDGYADGVEAGTPDAARALTSMADPPPAAGGGTGKASAAASIGSVTFIYNAAPGASGDVAAQVQEPAVKAALMRLLQEALLNAGTPVGT